MIFEKVHTFRREVHMILRKALLIVTKRVMKTVFHAFWWEQIPKETVNILRES